MLARAKTKQVCETSSCFEVDNIKTKQFCETSFKNRKFSAELTASHHCVLATFPVHVSQVLRLPRKSDAKSYDVLHLSRKIIFPKLKIWCSKMQPLSGNQRSDLLTSLMNKFLVLRLPPEIHLSRSSSHVPRLPTLLKLLQTLPLCSLLIKCTIPCACQAKRHLNVQKWSEHMVRLTFWRGNVLRATTACTFSTCQRPKVVRRWGVYILTWKCASRHNSVHFFDIFYTFSLGSVLRATTTCTFSTSQFQKALRSWRALYILTSKCASRHNGVQFFISHLATWLRTRRFSEPTFRPSGATNHWKKHHESRLFYLFARLHLLSSDFFSSLLTSAFPSVHIVGSFPSKLPSIIVYLFE